MMKLLDLAVGNSSRRTTGTGMSAILAGLYVGGFRDARDEDQLLENKISHIVSVHNNPKAFESQREYLCIYASDHPDEDLSVYFSTANDFIHEARLSGGGVLLHCLAGVSRSVTLTTAYVMTVTELGWRDALNAVRGARKQAYPNMGFKKLLRIFEQKDLAAERERFRAKFPSSEDPFDDKATCDKHTAAYQRWLELGDQLRDEHESWLVEHSASPS